MEMLSEKYGWTPQQIREMDEKDVLQYKEILQEIYNIEKLQQMRNKH